MSAHRSTTLNLFAEHCPAALDHYERGTPYDRDLFATGVAAHAVLQALAEQPHADPIAVADQVAVELAAHGRRFEASHEPPLPVERVLEGRQLALDWLARHPISEGAHPEIGLAVDAAWRPVPYAQARLKAILDLRYPAFEEIDGEPVEGIAHLDYKSAWNAGPNDLDSLQMKIQACIVLAHAAGDPAFIRQEIGNLRTGEIHSRTIWLDDEGHATIRRWQHEIEVAMAAADVQPRTARPGAGCPGCPYLHACKPARQLLGDDAADLVTRFVVADAVRAALRPLVAQAVAEGPVEVPGGLVGYVEVETREPVEDVYRRAAEEWHGSTDLDARWTALLSALPPTMGGVNALIAALHPTRRGVDVEPERDALAERWTVAKRTAQLMIKRNR